MTATPNLDAAIETDVNGDYAEYVSYHTNGDTFSHQVSTICEALLDELPAFTYSCLYEDEGIGAVEVGVTITDGRVTRNLDEFIDLKNATSNRSASGKDQARAIRDTLVATYDSARAFAVSAGLTLAESSPASDNATPTPQQATHGTIHATYAQHDRLDRDITITNDLLDRAAAEGYARTPQGALQYVTEDGDVSALGDAITSETIKNESCECVEAELLDN